MRVHADDLKAIFASMGLGLREANVDEMHGRAVAAFLAIAEAVEPSLVFSTEDDRLKWGRRFAELKYILSRWTAGSREDFRSSLLEEMADIASRSWRAPRAGPVRELRFIRSPELRRIAERDFATLASARKQLEIKTALVMAGSVIETVLLDVVENHPSPRLQEAAQGLKDRRQDKNQRVWGSFRPSEPESWQLIHLIGVAGPHGLGVLSRRTEQTADTARDWRNYVHPREERKADPLGPNDAVLAEAFVEFVLNDVEAWVERNPVPPTDSPAG